MPFCFVKVPFAPGGGEGADPKLKKEREWRGSDESARRGKVVAIGLV